MIQVNRINIGSKKGFTLVEVLVAVTIIVIAAAALLPVFSLVARSSNQNKIRSTANAIASGIFEQLNSMDYDKVGTENGNPSGNVPQFQQIEIDNVTYDVETRITWGSTVDTNGEVNNLAFKNVRIIVSAVNAFTGETETVDKMYSIVAREGGRSMPDKGNLRATVKQADGLGHEFPVVNIACNGPETFTMPTDEAGQVIFGMIEKGTYNVSAAIPSGWTVPQGYSVSGSIVTIPNVLINEWKVKDIFFYMDKPENFCLLSVKITDESGNTIDAQGKISIRWDIDGETRYVFKDKAFSGGDLGHDFIGRLWPQGTYSIKIDFSPETGYRSYDMSKSDVWPVIESTTEIWTGTFNNSGESINILIPVKTLDIRDAYSKTEAESFDLKSGSISTENCSDIGGTKNLNNIGNLSYAIYKYMNFGNGRPLTFQARVSAQEESKITVRLDNPDGTVIGALWISPTGPGYKTVSCVVKDQSISGIHDVCLVFEPGSGLKVNWFKFSRVFDDFSGSRIGTHWKTYGSNWSVNNGILWQQNSSQNSYRQAVLENAGLSETGNYTIIGKVRIDTWQNIYSPRAGISLFAGNGTGVSLSFFRQNRRRAGLMNGNEAVDYLNFSFENGQWYWFMISSNRTVQGTRFEGKFWIAGSDEPDWMFEYNADNNDFSGYPSLYTYGNCTVSFDDISVIYNDCTE